MPSDPHANVTTTADAMGLHHANTRALFCAKAGGKYDDNVGFDISECSGSSTTAHRNVGEDPSSWIVRPDDDELVELLAAYNSRKSEHDDALQDLESRKRRKEECIDRVSRSSERLSLLQKQQDRITNDVSKIYCQIENSNKVTENVRSKAVSSTKGELFALRLLVALSSYLTFRVVFIK